MKQGDQYLGAKRFEVVPSYGRVSKIVYTERSHATVYEAWRLRQDEWETVKEHVEVGINMPVLCQHCEAAYITRLAELTRDVKAGQRRNDWLGYYMLQWPHNTLPFLDGSKIWRSATKFEHWHQAES